MEGLVPIEFDADPERCQDSTAIGQCRYKALPGEIYCKIHVAGYARRQEKIRVRNYNIEKYKQRLEDFADSPALTTLHDEIAILRITLETVMNSCKDNHDIILQSNKIADLVTRIDKVVKSCHNLQKATGSLLDKVAAQHMFGKILTIITEHVPDPEILGKIADGCMKVIKEAQAVNE